MAAAAYDNRAYADDDIAIQLEENKVRLEIFSSYTELFLISTHINIQGKTRGGNSSTIHHCRPTKTGCLGKGHRVPVILHRLVRGIGERMAIPICSLGEWRRSLPYPLLSGAVLGWPTDLLLRNDHWTVLQQREYSVVRFLSWNERYRSHTGTSHLLRGNVLLGFVCNRCLLLGEFIR